MFPGIIPLSGLDPAIVANHAARIYFCYARRTTTYIIVYRRRFACVVPSCCRRLQILYRGLSFAKLISSIFRLASECNLPAFAMRRRYILIAGFLRASRGKLKRHTAYVYIIIFRDRVASIIFWHYQGSCAHIYTHLQKIVTRTSYFIKFIF